MSLIAYCLKKPTRHDEWVSSNIKIVFGKRVRALRRRRGWTQEDAAHELGLDRSYLAEIETGKRNPGLENIKVIADGFQVTMAQLFSKVR